MEEKTPRKSKDFGVPKALRKYVAASETAISNISSSALPSSLALFGVRKAPALISNPDSLETAITDTSSSTTTTLATLTPSEATKQHGPSSTPDSSPPPHSPLPLPSPPSPPPPPSAPRAFKYEVFLSFRGKDTRKIFADHLDTALTDNGIHTFKDDEELVRGEVISLNLSHAIEQSRYAVVVLSPNYADSAWCLNEIGKIMACREPVIEKGIKVEKRIKVFPVFYGVDPSDVRIQTGDHFEQAFIKHAMRYKDEMLQKWRKALSEVGGLSGWDLQDG